MHFSPTKCVLTKRLRIKKNLLQTEHACTVLVTNFIVHRLLIRLRLFPFNLFYNCLWKTTKNVQVAITSLFTSYNKCDQQVDNSCKHWKYFKTYLTWIAGSSMISYSIHYDITALLVFFYFVLYLNYFDILLSLSKHIYPLLHLHCWHSLPAKLLYMMNINKVKIHLKS